MSQFEKKSVNNGNLAIWLNSLKLGHLQTPQGKKTTGYSIPQEKTKSTKTTSSGDILRKPREKFYSEGIRPRRSAFFFYLNMPLSFTKCRFCFRSVLAKNQAFFTIGDTRGAGTFHC